MGSFFLKTLILGSGYILFLSLMIVTVSEYAIFTPKFVVSWTRNMSGYTLLPKQSLLSIFNNMCDVIEKAELVINFQKKEQ